MPDVLVTGIFGLVGAFFGAGTSGLIQYFLQRQANMRQALEEEQHQRQLDIEREAVKAGEVLSATHPWFGSIDALVILHIKQAREGVAQQRPDIVEKWLDNDRQFITALSSARVSAKNPLALQAFRDLSDARSVSVFSS